MMGLQVVHSDETHTDGLTEILVATQPDVGDIVAAKDYHISLLELGGNVRLESFSRPLVETIEKNG